MAEGASDDRYMCKAGLVRAYRVVLERMGVLQRVLDLLPPAPRRMLADAPPSNTWIDGEMVEAIYEAVERVTGIDGVRVLTRGALEETSLPHLRPVIQSFFRLFGTSPAAIFSRLDSLVGTSIRGVHYSYIAVDANACTVEVRFSRAAPGPVPLRSLVSNAVSFETVLDVCGKRGTVSPPKRVGDNAARFHITWA